MILLAQAVTTVTLPSWTLQAAGGVAIAVVSWFLSRMIRGVDRRQDECEARDRVHTEAIHKLETRSEVLEKRLDALDRTNHHIETLFERQRT